MNYLQGELSLHFVSTGDVDQVTVNQFITRMRELDKQASIRVCRYFINNVEVNAIDALEAGDGIYRFQFDDYALFVALLLSKVDGKPVVRDARWFREMFRSQELDTETNEQGIIQVADTDRNAKLYLFRLFEWHVHLNLQPLSRLEESISSLTEENRVDLVTIFNPILVAITRTEPTAIRQFSGWNQLVGVYLHIEREPLTIQSDELLFAVKFYFIHLEEALSTRFKRELSIINEEKILRTTRLGVAGTEIWEQQIGENTKVPRRITTDFSQVNLTNSRRNTRAVNDDDDDANDNTYCILN